MKGGYNNERKSLVPLVFCGVSYSCKRLGFFVLMQWQSAGPSSSQIKTQFKYLHFINAPLWTNIEGEAW